MLHEPSRPRTLPSRFSTLVSLPSMENEGFKERGFPVQTTPITERMVAISMPMPYTVLMAVAASSNDATPS